MHPLSKRAHEHWRPIVAAPTRSGQSVAAFCRERGMWPSSFFRWKRILATAKPTPAFVEVKLGTEVARPAGPEARPGSVRWRCGAGGGCGSSAASTPSCCGRCCGCWRRRHDRAAEPGQPGCGGERADLAGHRAGRHALRLRCAGKTGRWQMVRVHHSEVRILAHAEQPSCLMPNAIHAGCRTGFLSCRTPTGR